jgi:hypothetical protein
LKVRLIFFQVPLPESASQLMRVVRLNKFIQKIFTNKQSTC